MICTSSPGYSASVWWKYATTVLVVSFLNSCQPTKPATMASTTTTAPTITATRETLRQLQVADVEDRRHRLSLTVERLAGRAPERRGPAGGTSGPVPGAVADRQRQPAARRRRVRTRHRARAARCERPAVPAAAAPGCPAPAAGVCRHTGDRDARRGPARSGFGAEVTTFGGAIVRSVRVVPKGPTLRCAHGSGSAGRRKAVGGGRVRARRTGQGPPGPGMVRGALQHRRRRWRCAVGEPGAVGVGELERRQAGAAPEVLGVDAALLERRVDERLQDLVRQEVATSP